uniref:DUF3791 domain-containing protein n=1 Tax=Alloprevotella sp. TaxID=1872471 RepID=UPI003FEF8727
MLDFLLWNKIARIIAQLADTLHISTDRALQIFYDSDVCRMLHDKELGLHLMSDTYIVNDLIEELRKNNDYYIYVSVRKNEKVKIEFRRDKSLSNVQKITSAEIGSNFSL